MGGGDTDLWLQEHAAWRAGTPDEIVAWLEGYAAAGVQHAHLMLLPSTDLDCIDMMAREVLPALRDAS